MEVRNDLPILHCLSYDEWLEWLTSNLNATGAWVKFAKKGSSATALTYEEAREVALRCGWIDGQINAYDGDFCIRRFTPRRKKSVWSKINREIVEDLIEKGMMFPSGMAEVEIARKDGRWENAYASSSTIQEPEDLLNALAASPPADSFYKTLSKMNRYAVLWRIQTAPSPTARQDRIAKLVAMLERGEVFHS